MPEIVAEVLLAHQEAQRKEFEVGGMTLEVGMLKAGRWIQMADNCTHLDQILDVQSSGDGCVDCLKMGDWWVHLRMCSTCGHVGCCDTSKNQHATKHNAATGHPIIRSFEPGEDWYWCYPDELLFELEDAPPAPHHP